MTCSALSAGEPLAGTATVASRFLLIEHRGRWGRDALEGTDLPSAHRALADGFDGRVMLIRRPEATAVPVTYLAEVAADGGALRRLEGLDLEPGEDEPGQLLLVCAHGRRDACCARLGVPLYEALRPHVRERRLWQSSHHGGHRFAANLLALPSGVQLGRVRPGEGARIAAWLADGRIPLESYRGRTLHSPRQQAAEVAARRELGLDHVADVTPLRDEDGRVEVAVPGGVMRVRVTEEPGPPLPPSCGADPEPTVRYVARVE